ncbi:Gfo/Idh/MocA family protein [Amycolatopsis benzoatilytica]|uniref:Gfo/Idh/MocA family protein n=1 Tax=Amycolatopsis benzoatilytica TaxID=346045 RepID=UPI0009FFE80B|nr:Gfo/Idh/MocA family oxidoreductase [Amycolatopsis benzoatilytica]
MTNNHGGGGKPPVRVGVIGLGWFGRVHVDAWASVRGADLVGVCDRDPSAFAPDSAAAQAEFHADAGADGTPSIPADVQRHGSVDDLLASGIDLLDVVVTEDEHANCARAALESGVDVVVEKPLALTLNEAAELVALAERQGRRIYVGQVLRFDPRHIALAEAVHGKTLRHLSLSRHFQTSAHDVYGRAHPVLNAAVHDIDLAIWLAGRAPDRVSAFASHFLDRPNPDCLDLVLEWNDGLRAVVQNSWHLAPTCPYGFVFDCTVHAVEGTYMVRNEPVVQEWSATTVTAPELFFWPRYAGARRGALVAELQYVADCVTRGVPSDRVPLRDALQVMSTCQAAMDALKTGRPQSPIPLEQLMPNRGAIHA